MSMSRTALPERIEDALLALRAARTTHEDKPGIVTEAVVEHYQRKLDELLERYGASRTDNCEEGARA
jgi:hypothetical protein